MKSGVVRLSVCLILVLVCISFVLASTKITIKTLQYHPIEVVVADGTIKDYSKIANFKGDADQYGDFSFSVDTTKPLINLYIHVKDPTNYSNEIIYEKLMEQPTGKPLFLNVSYEGYELITTPKNVVNETGSALVNETGLVGGNESVNTSDLEVLSTDSKVTGSTIGDFFTSKTFFFSLGIIMVLIIIFILVKIFRKKKDNYGEGSNEGREVKIRKLSEVKQEKADDYKSLVEDAERKIKEAQEELGKLRNQDRLRAMQRKIVDDEKELMRLRRESGGHY